MQASHKARRVIRSNNSSNGSSAARDILNNAVKPLFENLERRQMLAAVLGQTLYVNDNWVVTTDNGAPGLDNGDIVADSDPSDNNLVSGLVFGSNAFDNFTSAQTAANNGDTVHFSAGQYTTQMNVTKQLSIVGDNVGKAGNDVTRYTKESTLKAANGSLVIGASNVTVDGLLIRDAATSGGMGVDVTSGSGITISHNIITQNSVGVVLDSGVSNFIVSDNMFDSNNRAGVNRGQGLRVVGNGGTGSIVRNQFTNHAAGVISSVPGAVSLVGAQNVTIGGGLNGNLFVSDAVGIRVSGTSTNIAIQNNNLSLGTSDLVVQSTNASVLSSLTGNAFGASGTYIDYAGSSNVDASSNTFGGASAIGASANLTQQFGIVNKIVDGVDAPSRGYVSIDPGHVYVTSTSEATNAGALVRGVGFATGSNTVHVGAGTFVGQIAISSGLTLTGAGDTTIIQAPASLANLFTTPGGQNHPVVYATGSNSVQIDHVKIDGAGVANGANYRMEGLAFYNAAGTVDHVTITGIRETPLGGSQQGVGLYVYEDTAGARTIHVTNNTISDYQKNGISIEGASLTVDINNNTVTGSGDTPTIAQNGIAVRGGAGGTITNNTVSGNLYSGPNSGSDYVNNTQSTGILLLGTAPGTSVSGNTVDSNDIGIYSLGNSSITNNTLGSISANRYEGIYSDQGTTTITGNSIAGSNIGIAVVSFTGNTANSAATISGDTISGSGSGIELFDDDISDAFKVTGNIFNNSISGTGTGTGIDVDGATARIQNNDLTGHLVGIRTATGAIVDAGDNGGADGNPTGLGTSTGNNVLTGYTGTSGNYAIRNENTTSNSEPNVLARNNNFGAPSTNVIVEQRILDDSDAPIGSRTQVLFQTFQNPASPPSVVYVDDDWAAVAPGVDADGAGPKGTGFGYDQFATIQDAIDAVTANGQVYVDAGTYNENIVLNKTVQLRGVRAGTDANSRLPLVPANESVITAANALNPTFTLQSGAITSIISGFTFSGGSVQLSAVSGPLNSLSVSGNIFTGFTGSAVSLAAGGTRITFSQNYMSGASQTGTAPILNLGSAPLDGLSITKNTITGGGANHTGLFANGVGTITSTSRTASIDSNTISNNKNGIDLGQSFSFGMIALDTLLGNSGDGVVGSIQDSLIRQNTFDGNGLHGLNLPSGTGALGAQRVSVINNFFRNSVGSDIFLDDTAGNNTFNTDVFNQNSITSATGVVYNGTQTLDMTFNWWGAANGPSGGGHVGNGVMLSGTGAALLDVAPWIRSGLDTPPNPNNGFQPDQTQLGHDAISISGINSLNESQTYTLTYSYNGDADLATVNKLIINWGDAFNPSNSTVPILETISPYSLSATGTLTHVFADGPSNPTIQIFAATPSRTFGIYPVKSITVNNVAPTFTVSSAGPFSFNEGSQFTLTISAVTDPGQELIALYHIDWGDGTTVDVTRASVAAAGGKVNHLYTDDNPAGTPSDVNTIQVSVQDEDSTPGFYPVLSSQTLVVTVANTQPTAVITGPSITTSPTISITEGSTNTLVFSGKPVGVVDNYTYSYNVTKNNAPYVTTTVSGTVTSTVTVASSGTTTAIPNLNFVPNDEGTYVVNFTLQDDDGGAPSSTSRTFIASNVAPSVSINPATVTVAEGGTATLTAVGTDPGPLDTITYVWNVTKNGNPYTITGNTSPTFQLKPDDNGVYVVSVTATDNNGGVSTPATKTITASNALPVATVTPSASLTTTVAEGSTVTLTASQTDAGTADVTAGFTYSWTVSKNGTPGYATATTQNFNFTPNDQGSYVVSLIVTDKDGGASTAVARTITGTNVAPAPSIVGAPATIGEGSTVGLTAQPNDPGTLDTFTYSWNVTKNGNAYATSTLANFNLVPNDDGTYVVSLGVTDNSSATGTAPAKTIIVNNVAPSPTITGVPANKPEGTPITLGSVTGDPGSLDTFTYSWTVTKDTGGGPVAYGTSGTSANYVFTPNDNASYVVNLTVTDNNGGSGSTSSTLAVTDVEPTIAVTGGSSLNEGSTYTVTLGAITDPGTDTITTYRIVWGDGQNSGFIAGVPTPGSTFTHRYDDGLANLTISVELADEDGLHTSGTKAVTVNNVNPTGTFSGNANVNLGDTGTVIWTTHTDPSNDDTANLVYDYDFNNDGVYEIVGSSSPSATVPASFLNTLGGHIIKSQIRDNDGGSFVSTFTITVLDASFRVVPGSFTPNNSGFSVSFNKSLATGSLNLYDGSDASVDAPDLIVTSSSNPSTPLHGSLIIDSATNTVTWVATGGILPNDTYTLTLVSGPNAFTHGSGDDLDGNTGVPGLENYTQNFAVSGSTRVVSLPDFTRGAGQNVHMPSDLSAGLPVRIDNPQGVTSVDFDLFYNPQLLNITGAALAAGVPGGYTITTSTTSISATLSKFRITISGGSQLSAGTSPMDIVSITANVPNSAAYGGSEVLRLENVVINGANSRGDYAVHKAAYVGDADRGGFYSGNDKSLIDRVVANLDSGFDAYQLIDPVVIADVDSNGALQGQDSSWVVQKSLSPASRPEIPNIPGIVLIPGAGPDPTIDIPDNITVTPGGTINVPLNITDSAAGLKGFNVTVAYDPLKMNLAAGFDSSDVTLGSLFTNANGWTINSFVDPLGTVTIAFSRIVPMTGGAGTFANLHFAVAPTFTGSSTLTPTGASSDGGLSFVYLPGSVSTDVLDFRYNNPSQPMSLVVTGNYSPSDLNLNSGAIPTANIAASYNAGQNLTTFTFPGYAFGALPDANYHAVIGGTKTYDFFFLNGDANRDKVVDINDLNILATNYQQAGKLFSQGDFNADGVVDAKDLGILSAHWQQALPGAVASQPATTGASTSNTRRAPVRAINLTDLIK